MARFSVMTMDAWVSIPFIMILLLAGLQALPQEIKEAAKVDGATGWQSFWKITFPLMLPVSITAIVLRIIFELKLADIVINVTAGGPGGATDTVSSFIFREYRDRSNVGYGTMLAEVYLVVIIVHSRLAEVGAPLDAGDELRLEKEQCRSLCRLPGPFPEDWREIRGTAGQLVTSP